MRIVHYSVAQTICTTVFRIKSRFLPQAQAYQSINIKSVQKIMAPKSKKKLEQYQNMTLEQLEALNDADDEEIEEDLAFNSDDEKEYGKHFSSPSIRSKNLSLAIPLQHKTVRIVEIAKGSKLTLSSVCLDVSSVEFHQVKLMVRCTYEENQSAADDDNDYVCLCNYLSVKKGGMGLQPTTPVNLEVAGPCKVEFRSDIKATSRQLDGGGINILGLVAPVGTLFGDDVNVRYADAFMSDDEDEDAEIDEESAFNSEDEKMYGKYFTTTTPTSEEVANSIENGTTSEVKKSAKKRKLQEDGEDAQEVAKGKSKKHTPAKKSKPGASDETVEQQQQQPQTTGNDKKLTKKQRKKLAQEKAKQLEETLSAARNDGANEDMEDTTTEKKSKKKKKGDSVSKSTSMTRERRLAGGLIVSDLLLGAGPNVKPGKRISLHYTGSLKATGKVFDKNNSKQHPLIFRQGTGEVIRGLEHGLEGMKVGGERIITVPSNLGYGKKGAGLDIPPGSDLVFEVKVLKVG